MTQRPGVLLDLDGTLIDTAPDLAAAANALRHRAGHPPLPLERLRSHASWGARGMLGAALGLAPGDAGYDDAQARFMTAYRERLTAEARPFPGMRQALAGLVARGLPWGVVTNKVEALAVPLIKAMAFEPGPACVIGGDTAGVAKPDPAPILLGCERAGLSATASIYVGDSARDIAAGRAAGLATIGVTYGYFDPDEDIGAWGADLLITGADDLVDAVNRLLERTGADARA